MATLQPIPKEEPKDDMEHGDTPKDIPKDGPETEPKDTPKDTPRDDPRETPFPRGPRFWAIMVSIALTGLLTALEATITSTALPSIIASLSVSGGGGGEFFVWAVNGYLLSLTALQPLFGQLADIYGRRNPTIFAVAAFLLGSGIAGGASDMPMLIAGRTIQGVGAGGINVLCEILVCDLVPLRQRGKYLAGVFGAIALGTALGPFFGGLIVENTSWRWVFYLNLPVGGVALVALAVALPKKNKILDGKNRGETIWIRLGRVDWVGNGIFVASISSVLIALAWAGTVYPWSSWRVVVPLVVGLVGMGGFFWFEGSRFCLTPTMPLHLFANRTSAAGFAVTFLHTVALMWTLYFLPVYFQGVLGSGPQYSGVQLLPTIMVLIPFAMVGGGIISRFGRYRPLHHVGLALMTVGVGLFSLLDDNSSVGAWVGFQIVEAAGAGLVVPALLPSILASLSESDTALATAAWSFIRSFGQVWGAAIAATIFNNRFDQLAAGISDVTLRQQLTGGDAYQHATRAFLETLSRTTRIEFISVLNGSLQRSWQIAIAFTGVAVLLVWFEREVKLRDELQTEYGVKQDSDHSAGESSGQV